MEARWGSPLPTSFHTGCQSLPEMTLISTNKPVRSRQAQKLAVSGCHAQDRQACPCDAADLMVDTRQSRKLKPGCEAHPSDAVHLLVAAGRCAALVPLAAALLLLCSRQGDKNPQLSSALRLGRSRHKQQTVQLQSE